MHVEPWGFWHLTIFPITVPTLIFSFVSEWPLSSYPRGGSLFILNVRSAPGCEHQYHNPLLSESPGLPTGAPWEIHTNWCIMCSIINITSDNAACYLGMPIKLQCAREVIKSSMLVKIYNSFYHSSQPTPPKLEKQWFVGFSNLLQWSECSAFPLFPDLLMCVLSFLCLMQKWWGTLFSYVGVIFGEILILTLHGAEFSLSFGRYVFNPVVQFTHK